jgi:hypothetical protein
MKKSALLVSISVLLFQCRTHKIAQTAAIQEMGCISCFKEGLGDGKATCEASAIVFDGNKIIIANDKDMPDGRTSVFTISGKGISTDTSKIAYLKNPIFKTAKKYEDFAITPSGKLVFLTTAFDRVKENSSDWDGYNTILYWPNGAEENPKVLSTEENATTSIALRSKIAQVLANDEFKNGMPYFKIEGLAATNNYLYLGVREAGASFKTFQYITKIIEVPYSFENNTVKLTGDFKLISDFKLSSLDASLPVNMSLSSIEYDKFNKRFMILSSFEDGEKLGAYLWTASLADLKNNQLHLVKDSAGQPFKLANKAEDLAIINKKQVYIINDDDRVKTKVGSQTRQGNQAAFHILKIK